MTTSVAFAAGFYVGVLRSRKPWKPRTGAFAFGAKPAVRLRADRWWGENLPAELLDPDGRWQNWMVGEFRDFVTTTAMWRTNRRVPEGPARMLEVSRALFRHSYFVHEFGIVASLWALFAIEAALHDVLEASEKARLFELLNAANERGLLDDRQCQVLHLGRRLRNDLAHPKRQGTFTLGMSGPIIETVHQAVDAIYRRPQ